MKKILMILTGTLAFSTLLSAWSPKEGSLLTGWGEKIDPDSVLQEYPRPQMARDEWKCLNGLWSYAVSPADAVAMPSPDGEILVPFAIESSLSGVCKRISSDEALWYRTRISIPADWKKKSILLHFGAVDWQCEVWVNGKKACTHTGGYTAFSVCLDPFLVKGKQEITVKVIDGTDNNHQPRGKQVSEPKGIWYTPVTGIWQTVWMEPVSPKGSITDYKAVSDIDNGTISITPFCKGTIRSDLVSISLTYKGEEVARSLAEAGNTQTLKIKEPHLWTPDTPQLYDFTATLLRKGKEIDKVQGYTAMRKISAIKDALGNKRLALNGKILFQYGPLDQGWWPDGLYTAPCDDALKFDIEKTKEFGFNMIRKHVKIEPARWYMWCDRLGIIVWQDMPNLSGSCGGLWSQKVLDAQGRNYYDSGSDSILSDADKDTYRKEWKEIIGQLDKFQCICVWVPFNECWSQFNTGAIVEYTRSLDPTRLINGASGGNWVKGEMGDILDSHHYPAPKMRIIDKNLINVLGEYGGIGRPVSGHLWQEDNNWGYVKFSSEKEVTDKYVEYAEQLEKIAMEGCAAAVYTQTTDVENEVNGIMTYDRKLIKMDINKIKMANEKVIRTGSSSVCTIREEDFLINCDKAAYRLITIKGGDLTMQVTNFGGRVISLWVPDRNGNYADVVVGYNTLMQYTDNKGERFLGSSPGPVANRIGKASFKLGKNTFNLSANDGVNTLHGGFKGIDMLVWDIVETTPSSVTFEVVHPDGLDGFPGNTRIRMKYTLTDNNEFKVDFTATSDKDTPVNLAHHSFFNLRGCGNGTVLDHILTINASANTPVDSTLIPTGEIQSLEGTPRDFRKPHAIGERINDYSDPQMAFGHGYDHNFVLDREGKEGVVLAATVYEPEFGRVMEVLTDQPGLQFYSGYFFDGSVKDKYGKEMVRNCSLALETQKFPDAVNHPEFPNIVLKAGDTYTHSCVYRFKR